MFREGMAVVVRYQAGLFTGPGSEPAFDETLSKLRRVQLDGAAWVEMALSRHYGVTFESVGFNLYRDGHDSVAWHRDNIRNEMGERPDGGRIVAGS